jgi:hypothetical protein
VTSANYRSKFRVIAMAASSRKSSSNTNPAGRAFDDKIISLYAHGLTVREIQSHLEEL